jgi:hypothetical protein
VKESNNTLYLGTFNSELYWKEFGFSELPSISDLQSDNVLSVLDELQFAFCTKSNDVLITRLPFDQFHKEYLCLLGFEFKSNDVQPKNEKGSSVASICDLISGSQNLEYFSDLTSSVKSFSPYSILPESELLLQKLQLDNSIPSIEIVKKVNSKVFSTILSKKIGGIKKEELAYSAEDLLRIGKEMLSSSHVLIKDPMGVSGKGNMLINSEKLLSRICSHIQKQEQNGKKTSFVIESLLNKKSDFSSQLLIDKSGEIKLVTVQVMKNNGFAFSGIQTSDNKFLSFLDKTEYFNQVEWIGREIYKEGYFGPVCIDSMVDQDYNVIPIIEINARKSMGLINYAIDQHLANFSVKGNLMYLSLILKNKISFEKLLKRLDELGILFTSQNTSGILPLSANAININVDDNATESMSCKGRFYFSLIVKDNEEKKDELLSKLNFVFNEFNIKVVN